MGRLKCSRCRASGLVVVELVVDHQAERLPLDCKVVELAACLAGPHMVLVSTDSGHQAGC